ncbi:unnamed protein product, partial [Amoebophrya sp. A25]
TTTATAPTSTSRARGDRDPRNRSKVRGLFLPSDEIEDDDGEDDAAAVPVPSLGDALGVELEQDDAPHVDRDDVLLVDQDDAFCADESDVLRADQCGDGGSASAAGVGSVLEEETTRETAAGHGRGSAIQKLRGITAERLREYTFNEGRYTIPRPRLADDAEW